VEIEEKNAVIKGTSISSEDHGILSAWLYLDFGGSGQGFGGYGLYLPESFKKANNEINYAGHFIWRVLEIVDVTEWGRLKGKTIRVRTSPEKIHSIGHIIKNDWFDPSEDFAKMKENRNELQQGDLSNQ